MKYTMIITHMFPALLWAQEYQFQREWDSVQVEIQGYNLPAGWTGGYIRSCPDFCDIDADGDLDAFVGSFNGRLELWENQGSSAQFAFHLTDPTFQGLDSLQATWPEFWDMDSDGDLDLFLYNWIWGFQIYENVGSTITPNLTLIDSSLSDVEGNPIWGADPALVDIDADGDQDLFIGTFTDGYLKYYQNVGDSIQYAYLLINGNYLGSGTGEWCSPEFWDIDADGDYDLFIGDWYGRIWYCRNDGTAQQAQYTLVSSYWLNIDVTNYAIPEFADTDGDGDCDLWVGRDVYDLGPENTPGDVFYLENTGTPQLPQFQPIRTSNLTIDVGTANRMLISDFDASGTLDLVISNRDYLIFYSNYGTVAQPRFELITEDFLNGILPHGLALYDLDADSDQDMVTANGAISNGEITFYRNVGTAQNPLYEYSFLLQTPYTLGMVTLADMDADGDGDMLVAKAGGGLAYYQDLGTPQSPSFVLQTEDWQGLPAGRNPRFADMDLDGDFDLLTGFNLLGLVELWENVGTPQNAQMVLADSNFCQMQISSPKPSAGDLDNDGDVDLLVGSGDGGIYFFRNITGEVSAPPPVYRHPQAGLQISLGPNPANPFVVASFELRVASNMSLDVFDLLGRRVAELASGFHLPGEYRYVWDAGNRAAGMYIIRLKTPQQSLAEKLTIIK